MIDPKQHARPMTEAEAKRLAAWSGPRQPRRDPGDNTLAVAALSLALGIALGVAIVIILGDRIIVPG